jgi:23S rRNA (adenine2503-C2)-methyltransferase
MNGAAGSLTLIDSPSPALPGGGPVEIHDLAAFERRCRALRIDQHQRKQVRNAFYKRFLTREESLDELPCEQRQPFAESVCFHSLELMSRHDSRLDGATKLIFRTRQGLLLESVILRINTGRTALCVSSQVGCAARCAFCASGTMGLARNLSAAEILDQVIQANQLLRRESRWLRNVVFMGMGEPFHNEENVHEAIDVLRSPRCFNLSERHLLVSTVGITDAMIRCARRFPQVGMALSLHSARQETRTRLVPLARRHDVSELRATAREVTALQGRRLMIEYTLFANINDTSEEAAALIEFCREIPVHVNLIPYNPIDSAPELSGSDAETRRRFARMLRDAGLRVTQRYSLGSDIAAACGQLVRNENREVKVTP